MISIYISKFFQKKHDYSKTVLFTFFFKNTHFKTLAFLFHASCSFYLPCKFDLQFWSFSSRNWGIFFLKNRVVIYDAIKIHLLGK